ncbi:MAG: PEP-utilizing enzyme [Actinomycetota bacterium]
MKENAFRLNDPVDENLTWYHENMHTPTALTPLACDYMCFVLEGINARNDGWGVPMHLRMQIINSFLYIATEETSIPESEVDEVYRAAARARAPEGRMFWENEVMPTLLEAYSWIEAIDTAGTSLEKLSTNWDEAWDLVLRLYDLHFQVTGMAYRTLEDLADAYEAVVEDAYPGEALSLVQGLARELQKTQSDMYALAAKAQEVPELEEMILNQPQDALQLILSKDSTDPFGVEFDAFMRAHGHLGQAYDDLRQASWIEEPLLLISEIATRLRAGNPDPSEKFTQTIEKSKLTEDALMKILSERPDDLAMMKDKVALARSVGPLTEDHNYWIDRQLHSKMRSLVWRVGKRMMLEQIIGEPDDIFFLHHGEVSAALKDGANRKTDVEARRASFKVHESLSPPATVGAAPMKEETADRFSTGRAESDDPSLIKGSAASAGKASGPARVVLSNADFAKVGAGDILICPSSNPSYVPLFGIIGGLVTDTGGVTSHAAVVAREFGVPAVVGTRKGTKTFLDGDLIEVDGSKGEVRKI